MATTKQPKGKKDNAAPTKKTAKTSASEKELINNGAIEAFSNHPHLSKVWVDPANGEWHLCKRKGLVEVTVDDLSEQLGTELNEESTETETGQGDDPNNA